ncbi:MAG: restriction endonuclease subunit S [Propionibacteriaceae bacterium]|nr:restriction endonuclease subunit S [Propionibacteriaceae bacterium]
MREVALGKLLAPAKVRRAGGTEFPVLSMTMHGGLVSQSTRFKKRIASLDTSDYKVVKRGQLVVGFPINEGVLDFQFLHDKAVVSPAYGVWDLRDADLVDRAYLKRFLRSPRAIAYYTAKMKGSTARRRSLPAGEFNAMPIPLPPLPEQRRIAEILDHADALRAKRRQVLAHLDALTQSIFHDMFAGTTRRARLKDIGVDFLSGKNVIGTEPNVHSTNRVVKVSAISSGAFVPSESKPMPSNYAPPESHRIRAGDVLFGRASGSLDLLGATAVVGGEPRNLFLPDKVWRLVVRPHGEVEAPYVLGVLRSGEARAFIRHNASGAAGVRNIGKAKLLEYAAPLPSLARQRDFADNVAAHQKLRDRVESAASEDEVLFASLQSRAFRGEL